jgi:hypothetical protein
MAKIKKMSLIDRIKQRQRPLNDPSWCETFCCVTTDSGGQQFGLSDVEAARYDADPDGWAAKHFGMTLNEYYQWVARNCPDLDLIAPVGGKP